MQLAIVMVEAEIKLATALFETLNEAAEVEVESPKKKKLRESKKQQSETPGISADMYMEVLMALAKIQQALDYQTVSRGPTFKRFTAKKAMVIHPAIS